MLAFFGYVWVRNWCKDGVIGVEQLDCELLLSTILKTSPDTRIRKRYCLALNALAKFAGLELDAKHLVGSYGPKQLSPRDLPDDETICQWFFNIKDPAWRWAYGAIATFGLDVSLAAAQQGHSLKVHTELYHRWISDRHHQRAFDLLMMRGDRPKAPLIF